MVEGDWRTGRRGKKDRKNLKNVICKEVKAGEERGSGWCCVCVQTRGSIDRLMGPKALRKS